MKTYVLHTPGGVENLHLETVDAPQPSEGEVRIAVRAISINPVDVKLKYSGDGLVQLTGADENVILGWDVAGVVDAVGPGVTAVQAGDRVFGLVNFPGQGRAYAEQVVAPVEQLASIPPGIEFVDAAAATLAALTALQALDGRVGPGSRVLIHAGSGGVGHFAVQMAKKMGAHVTSTSSGRNRDFVLGLGADEHIDYRERDFETVVSDLDLVFDTVGPEVAARSIGVLRRGGTLVSIALGGAEDELQAKAEDAGVSVETMLVHSDGPGMERISAMLADGSLQPAIHKVFPFDELADAHAEVERGRSVGKVVVTL